MPEGRLLRTKLLKATYVPGLHEPGGNGPNPWGSMIPPEARGTLIAAFNSGFKMDQARGGVYFGGQEVRPLVGGAASLVIFKDGTASVGVWGRDFNMSPEIESAWALTVPPRAEPHKQPLCFLNTLQDAEKHDGAAGGRRATRRAVGGGAGAPP